MGNRVRITAPAYGYVRTTGDLTSIEPDAFTVRVGGRPGLQSVRLEDISSMDISIGSRTQKLKGAGVGLLSGMLAGAALGFVDGDEPRESGLPFTAWQKAAFSGIFFGLVGTGIGTIWGALDRTDRWTPAALRARTVRMRLGPGSGRGIRLGVSIAY